MPQLPSDNVTLLHFKEYCYVRIIEVCCINGLHSKGASAFRAFLYIYIETHRTQSYALCMFC